MNNNMELFLFENSYDENWKLFSQFTFEIRYKISKAFKFAAVDPLKYIYNAAKFAVDCEYKRSRFWYNYKTSIALIAKIILRLTKPNILDFD